jgi:hypothetical protein
MSFHFLKFAHKPIVEEEDCEEEVDLATLSTILYNIPEDDSEVCLLESDDNIIGQVKMISRNICNLSL